MSAEKRTALISLLGASLVGVKLALGFIPFNVEIVTLTIALYSIFFGLKHALPATLIFVLIEGIIYGFHVWFVLYLIYFPLLSVVFWLFSKRKFKDKINEMLFATVLAVVMTLFFGVFSTALEAQFLLGGLTAATFSARYLTGILFFTIHVASNIAAFACLYIPMSKLFTRLKKKYFQNTPLTI
jgi:energy-coupling factor transport system substrate-specific component